MNTFSDINTQTQSGEYNKKIESEKIIRSKPEVNVVIDSEINSKPKFSIIMRTQGKRIDRMEQAIVCLLSQEYQSYELIVVGHNIEQSKSDAVEKLIKDFGSQLSRKASFIVVNTGLRGVPMNVGIDRAVGDYIGFLDDDDLVFAHWLSVFSEKIDEHPGKIIRSRCVDRFIEHSDNDAIPSYVHSGLEDVRAAKFSLSAHFFISQTVLHQYVTPRLQLVECQSYVDETLPVVEDWDFLLRNAELFGVVDTGQITCIYNRWSNQGSSLHEFDSNIWSDCHRKIFMRFNDRGILIPSGELVELYKLWMTQERFKDLAGELIIDGDQITINKKKNAFERKIQYYDHANLKDRQYGKKELLIKCANAFLPKKINKLLKRVYIYTKKMKSGT